MGDSRHYVHPPEWVIEASGDGGFRVRCTCGWMSDAYDISLGAREAGRDHADPVATAGPRRGR
jgi:hypothetical protein